MPRSHTMARSRGKSRQGLLVDTGPTGPLAGIDEAGRGCLAGPVTAAVVILPSEDVIDGLADSKQLSHEVREELAPLIRDQALAWGLGMARAAEIDRLNILQATFLAMARAVACLRVRAALLAVDGNRTIPGPVLKAVLASPGYADRAATVFDVPQKAVIGGDASVPAISAASILAKVHRDRLMTSLDKRWPGYGLARHKGYGTAEHLAALESLGPSPIHRMTFRGVRDDEPSATESQCLPGL